MRWDWDAEAVAQADQVIGLCGDLTINYKGLDRVQYYLDHGLPDSVGDSFWTIYQVVLEPEEVDEFAEFVDAVLASL